MKNKIQFLILLLLLTSSCHQGIEKTSIETLENEILQAEQNFAEMAQEKGIEEAFLTYAAEDAVLMRNNKLVIGKNEIEAYFMNQTREIKDENLSWKPDFVDVASSGDLAYTYGQYIYSYTDTSGIQIEHKGVFHTVWKKQADGAWRFVWD